MAKYDELLILSLRIIKNHQEDCDPADFGNYYKIIISYCKT